MIKIINDSNCEKYVRAIAEVGDVQVVLCNKFNSNKFMTSKVHVPTLTAHELTSEDIPLKQRMLKHMLISAWATSVSGFVFENKVLGRCEVCFDCAKDLLLYAGDDPKEKILGPVQCARGCARDKSLV